jgi:hypothetical protein
MQDMWFRRSLIEKMLISIPCNKKRGLNLIRDKREGRTVSQRPSLCKASRGREEIEERVSRRLELTYREE